MSENPRGPLPGGDLPDADEIEILEVVGVDEDGPDGVAVDGEALEELEVVFDDATPSAGEAPPAAPASPPAQPDAVARERLLRLQADFDNLRKRIERERDDHHRHATAGLVSRLLPVLDNFERAIVAGRQPGGIGALLEGVELVHRQFLEELRREGLRDIDAIGLAFDPEVHEAVATDPESALPPNTVVEEMQRGYYFHDRVLRPALVRVSVDGHGAAEPEDDRED